MEENASITGFHTISTLNYKGFDERVLSDLEQIIVDFTGLPRVQALIAFYATVRDHLLSCDTHGLKIANFKGVLIRQLYQAYRDAGFTGSIGEMLTNIVSGLKVASIADITAGYSERKVTPAPGWKYLADAHEDDLNAHLRFKELTPTNCGPLMEPSFYFTPKFYNPALYETGGYTIDQWNTSCGSLYLDFTYDFTNDKNGKVLFDIDFLQHHLLVSISYTTSSTMTITVTFGDVVKTITVTTGTIGCDRLLIIYNQGDLLIRDETTSIHLTCNLADILPVALILHTTLGTTGTSIREFSYYPVALTSTEQLFLLN